MEITPVAATSYRINTEDSRATVALANGELQVEWLWVAPAKRSTGAAEALLRALKDHFSLPVRPVCVLESALGFWNRMTDKGVALEPDFVY